MAENILVTIVDPKTGVVSYHNIPASDFREESYAHGSVQKIEYTGTTGPGGWSTDTSRKVLYERGKETIEQKKIDRKIIEEQQQQQQGEKNIPNMPSFDPSKAPNIFGLSFGQEIKLKLAPILPSNWHTTAGSGTSTPSDLEKVTSPSLPHPSQEVLEQIRMKDISIKVNKRVDRDIQIATEPIKTNAQEVYTSEYNRLISSYVAKPESGITFDTTKNMYYYKSESSLENFQRYSEQANKKAMLDAQKYYVAEVGKIDVKGFQQQEYGKFGLNVHEYQGKMMVLSDKQLKEQIGFEWEKAGIEKRMYGKEGIGGQLLEFGRFWYSGFTPQNIGWTSTLATKFTGGDVKDQLAGMYQGFKAQEFGYGYNADLTWVRSFVRSYEPGGAGFLSFIPAAPGALAWAGGSSASLIAEVGVPLVFASLIAKSTFEAMAAGDIPGLAAIGLQTVGLSALGVSQSRGVRSFVSNRSRGVRSFVSNRIPEMEVPNIRPGYEPRFSYIPVTRQTALESFALTYPKYERMSLFEKISTVDYLRPRYSNSVLDFEKRYVFSDTLKDTGIVSAKSVSPFEKIKIQLISKGDIPTVRISPYNQPKTVQINLLGEKIVKVQTRFGEDLGEMPQGYKAFPGKSIETYFDTGTYKTMLMKDIVKEAKIRWNTKAETMLIPPGLTKLPMVFKKPGLDWAGDIVKPDTISKGGYWWLTGGMGMQKQENLGYSIYSDFNLGEFDINKISSSEFGQQPKELSDIIDKSLSMSITSPMQVDLGIQDTRSMDRQISEQVMGSMTAQEFKSDFMQDMMQEQKTTYGSKLFLPFIYTPEEKKKLLKKKTLLPGFDVFIKGRTYVHGKKTLVESWIQVNKEALSEYESLSLGALSTKKGVVASFKIQPSNTPIIRLSTKYQGWGGMSSKYYTKGDVFIEKPRYRLETSQEIIDILSYPKKKSSSSKPRVSSVFSMDKYMRSIGYGK